MNAPPPDPNQGPEPWELTDDEFWGQVDGAKVMRQFKQAERRERQERREVVRGHRGPVLTPSQVAALRAAGAAALQAWFEFSRTIQISWGCTWCGTSAGGEAEREQRQARRQAHRTTPRAALPTVRDAAATRLTLPRSPLPPPRQHRVQRR